MPLMLDSRLRFRDATYGFIIVAEERVATLLRACYASAIVDTPALLPRQAIAMI